MRIQHIIQAALFTPGARGCWGLPMLFWGPPGIAKTDIIEGVAHASGLPCEVLSPGERGEGAFGAIPVPREQQLTDEEGDAVSRMVIDYPMPAWALQFAEAKGAGLVFVDETNTAPPAIQPALMGLLHARRIGGGFLGPRVRVLGAANPIGTGAGGYDLAPPVANRMGHLDWPMPDVDAWVSWLTSATDERKGGGDAAALEERVLRDWPGAFAHAKGLVSGFLRARRTKEGRAFLYDMPEPNDPRITRAWPSPRTWELATRALAGARVHGLGEEEDGPAFVGSFVGEGPAIELFAYIRDADLPMPEDVLDGKVKFKHDARRLDKTMAVLSSCAAFLTPPKTPKREKRADVMWDILGGLLGDADDLVVLGIKAMSDANLASISSAVPVLLKARPVLTAAGIGRGAR